MWFVSLLGYEKDCLKNRHIYSVYVLLLMNVVIGTTDVAGTQMSPASGENTSGK